jgi:hypothetical protein
MVSCQEPYPLKGSKHSWQCHPHDAALVNALSFVSMGVEARCHPSKSTAHLVHMKRQPFLCNGHPCHGRHHCHCRWHLCCRCQLSCRSCRRRRRCCCHHCHCHLRRHCHCRCRRRCNCPLPSPLLLSIAVVVSVNNCRRHLCHVALSHRCCRRPCRRPLPSLSLSAIAVAIAIGHHRPHAIGHFQELLPWHGKNCIRPIETKNAHLILFCLDSGRRIDQSRMTAQVSSGDGQHQCWAASSKQ